MSVEAELREVFSNPFAETLEGIIAAGGWMTPDLLEHAYKHGIFPWPHEGYPLLWFCPDERGVIDFSELHLPKSFQKWMRSHRHEFTVTMNARFTEVVFHCRTQKRKDQTGSWINSEIEKNYYQLHKAGKAFSLEISRGEDLVGGIYGVKSDTYYSCESMFHREDNVSKLALYELIQFLKKSGYSWMDIQMVTPVCASFGGKLIPKPEFLARIGLSPAVSK